MEKKNILILGGYGNTGRLIAHYLLQNSSIHTILAGPNQDKALAAAEELNQAHSNGRASGIKLNANDLDALANALRGMDMLVVASSTSNMARKIARICLQARVDYFDVQFSIQKVRALKEMSQEIEAAGCCFITDGGFHPGLPTAMIRFAAGYFDVLLTARVGSVIRMNWPQLHLSESTVLEMAEEFNQIPMVYFSKSRWKKARMDMLSDTIRMDFGPPFGLQTGIPMFLEELSSLPEKFPSLTDTGFFIGGFNPVTDYLIMPLMMLLLKLAPVKGLKLAGRLLLWGLNKFSKPPYGTRIKLEAAGQYRGSPKSLQVLVSHADGYVLTAVPAALTILQSLFGGIRRPGLFTQAEIVNPEALLIDMSRLGIGVTTTYSDIA